MDLENHARRGDENKKTNVEFRLLLGGTRLEIEENSGGIKKKFPIRSNVGRFRMGVVNSKSLDRSIRSRSEKALEN